jgi:hypothetical protein
MLRLGFWSTIYGGLPVILLVLPANMSARRPQASGYFKTTLSNIPIDDHETLVCHVLAMVWSQLVMMALIFSIHLEYSELRRAWMKSQARNRTVLVSQIPSRLRSAPLLEAFFESLYSDGEVQRVEFCKFIDRLDKAVERRERTLVALERALLSDAQEPTTGKVALLREKLAAGNAQVQALLHEVNKDRIGANATPLASVPLSAAAAAAPVEPEFFPLTGRLLKFLGQMKAEAAAAKRLRELKVKSFGARSDRAFVTFRTPATAILASQVSHATETMTVELAPDTQLDIFWENLHQPAHQRRQREAISWAITLAIVLLFVFPVMFLNNLFGPERMKQLASDASWPVKASAGMMLPMTLVRITSLNPNPITDSF